MKKKKIIIIGAGPGGLTAAMLLSHRGFDVHVFEKNDRVGGRNQMLEYKGFKFDIGPTFLMMKFILDEVFEEAGKDINDYLKTTELDPLYRLQFEDFAFEPSKNHKKTEAQIKKIFPNEVGSFKKMMTKEKIRFQKMYPCLQKSYHSWKTLFHRELIGALPHLSLGKSMFSELGKYFKNEKLKLSFTFQSKYLGMSPWDCPAAFMIIPFIEHNFGIFHVEGGLSEISNAMAKAAIENGAKIHLNSPVKKLLIEKKTVKGVVLKNNKIILGDETVINSDFAYSMKYLAAGKSKKYSSKKLLKKKYSCSTFMLYLGLNKKIRNLPHHTIIFSKKYKKFISEIFKNLKIENDLSIYIRNASNLDNTLAPKGQSALYVLVPVPNQKSGINWKKEKIPFKNKVIKMLEEKIPFKNIKKHIVAEKIITPFEWEKDYNVFLGATFNLSHSLGQMLYFRPHNQFEEFKNCFLVGGGTHPGSGLPTIYESGRISANLISKKHSVQFTSKNLQI